MAVQQVPPHQRFPSGDSRPLVVLAGEPQELSARFGLSFEEGQDDFDAFQLAAIALADGSHAWLLRYQGDPNPGTIVYVDTGADFAQAKALLTQALDLAKEDVLWVSPFAAAPAAST